MTLVTWTTLVLYVRMHLIFFPLSFFLFLYPFHPFHIKLSIAVCLLYPSYSLSPQVSKYPSGNNFRGESWNHVNYTGVQRNWGKLKNNRFYLIWGCWIQIWNPFLLITSSFLDIHSVNVHIRFIKAYMNSGLILILWDLWLIFLVIMH